MGYYTRFELEIFPEKTNEVNFLEIHNDVVSEDYSLHAKDITMDHEDMKWYQHEEDMRSFSKKYPNVLFQLTGHGEEAGDVWRKYFKDGKMQETRPEFIFDDFDPKKLS